jgi:hypothetical protein
MSADPSADRHFGHHFGPAYFAALRRQEHHAILWFFDYYGVPRY